MYEAARRLTCGHSLLLATTDAPHELVAYHGVSADLQGCEPMRHLPLSNVRLKDAAPAEDTCIAQGHLWCHTLSMQMALARPLAPANAVKEAPWLIQ